MHRILLLFALWPAIALGAERSRPPLCLTVQAPEVQRQQQGLVHATVTTSATEFVAAPINLVDYAPRPVRTFLMAGWRLGPTSFVGGGMGASFGGNL